MENIQNHLVMLFYFSGTIDFNEFLQMMTAKMVRIREITEHLAKSQIFTLIQYLTVA